MATDLVELETAIDHLPGVQGCAIFSTGDGGAGIQVFTRLGSDRMALRRAVMDEVERRGLVDRLGEILIFELDADRPFSDRDSLRRVAQVAAEEELYEGLQAPAVAPGRVALRRVVVSSESERTNAEVALARDSVEVVGRAAGETTPHGLFVLARATTDALHRLAGSPEVLVQGASLVTAAGRDVVFVFARVGNRDLVGASVVRDGSVAEAAVKATLDAVNRSLGGGA